MRYLSTMANYNTWANSRIFELCASLNDYEYRLDRKSFFGSIHGTLNHILLVDILWMTRLKREELRSIESLSQILYEDFDELRIERVRQDQKLTEFFLNIDSSELSRTLKFSRMDGSHCEGVMEDLIVTLFNHQTHHRGQIHAMLTQSGIPNSDMPDLDVIDYLADSSLISR